MTKPIAKILVKQARDAWAQDDKELAFQRSLEALNADPNCGEAVYLAFTYFISKGWYGLSMNGLLKAHDMMPREPGIINNVGLCLRKIGLDDAARDAWMKAKEMAAAVGVEDGDIYTNLCSVSINAAKEMEAEAWARMALRINPNDTAAWWNLSLALLEQGKLKTGWKTYESGYKHGLRLNKQFNCAPWFGQKVKRLVVFGEQGQGDELMFNAALPDAVARCDELIIDCHSRLAPLFQRSFPNAIIYPTRKTKAVDWIYNHEPISAKVSSGDLNGIFRKTLADFDRAAPFIKTNPAFDAGLKRRVRNLAQGKPVVGIAWEGGTMETHVWHRTPDFSLFRDLILAFPQVQWVSCHYKRGSAEFLKSQGLDVVHWQEVIDNFDGLTSLIGQMDMVITVDQTAVHQAGAIGQPCWVLTPHCRSFRYMKAVNGKTLPDDRFLWYGDHVKLFRQDESCKWEPVFQAVKEALAAYIGAKPDAVDIPRIPKAAKRVPSGQVRLWGGWSDSRQASA